MTVINVGTDARTGFGPVGSAGGMGIPVSDGEICSPGTPPPPVPDPTLTGIAPATASLAAGAVALTATGTDFTAASVINVDGAAQATTFVGPTSLTATYTPAAVGVKQVTVSNDPAATVKALTITA